MALPKSREAQVFYPAAIQRFDDALFLLEEGGRTTAAVYLAGYSVECMLKALILSMHSGRRHTTILQSFKGSKAHDFHWLRDTYFKKGEPSLPREIARCFIIVGSWSTALRYQSGMTRRKEAEEFLAAAQDIIRWAQERM
jgi:HEPN domain-containing protein